MKKNKAHPLNSKYETFIKYGAGITKEVGIGGFIGLTFVFVFLFWGSSEQKREFIDLFILMKNISANPFPAVLIILTLVFIIVTQSIYCSKMIKMRKQENNRIGQEKTELQRLLIKKGLKSSK